MKCIKNISLTIKLWLGAALVISIIHGIQFDKWNLLLECLLGIIVIIFLSYKLK